MKLISFDERPKQRTKDPRDIANIIDHFLDLQGDLIFNNHNDLFTEDVKEDALDEISATVIGREIKKICADNEKLLERLKQML